MAPHALSFESMKSRKQLTTVSVVLAAAVLSALIWVNRDRFTPLDVGSRAPDYAAYTLAGDTVQLSSFFGDVVLLNIWATWCLPCVREMPALQRLHEDLGGDGLRVVAVSVDAPAGAFGAFGQPGGDVAEFRDRFGLTFDILHDPSGRIQARYQVHGLPTTFVIDREGRIRRRVIGAAEWDQPRYADDIRRIMEG
jgi:cytochrome c biogenesis protein CcmG, thiol:disulfide interchange protein DsbE